MKPSFFIFAYKGNAAQVPVCVRAIQRLRPQARVVVVAEDDGGEYASGLTVIRSTFDRQRNLNGREAILGILGAMIQNAGEANWVWKVDPDTVLLNDAVMNVGESRLAGYAYPADYVHVGRTGVPLLGCCYGMEIGLAKDTLDSLAGTHVCVGMPEDVAITSAAYDLSNGKRHALPVNQSPPYAMHFWRWASPLPIERYRTASAVNLGNPGGTLAQQIELADRLIDQMPARGLGDIVAKVTAAVGIKPCRGCKGRQKALNDLIPFS